jgi:allophanate hydrolase subunit 2
MAIKGGITSEIRLGSSSFYLSVTKEGQLKKNDTLLFDQSDKKSTDTNKSEIKTEFGFDSNELEVFKGPEFELLPKSIQNKLENTSFTINTQSNRMAYWLEHSEDISAKDIITAPVQPGTVQMTPVGKVIVLMRDAQTTGGYARIFQLTKNSIDLLAQKRAGETVSFKIMDPLFHMQV